MSNRGFIVTLYPVNEVEGSLLLLVIPQNKSTSGDVYRYLLIRKMSQQAEIFIVILHPAKEVNNVKTPLQYTIQMKMRHLMKGLE